MGPDLMGNMMEQAKRFGAKIVPETVQSVDFSSQPLRVKTENAEYLTKTVILSMGADANWLGLPSEQRLRGKGVSACATCDGFFFRGKELVVIGGGDSAMEEADFLTKFASKVTVVHRRSELRASKIMQARVQANPKVQFILDTEITDVLGTDRVTGVQLHNLKTGESKEFACDGLFLAIGHTPNTKLLAGHVELDAKGYVVLKEHTMTSVPGVFVGGDINDTRYKQAVSAAGMGCMAALDAEKWLAEHAA